MSGYFLMCEKYCYFHIVPTIKFLFSSQLKNSFGLTNLHNKIIQIYKRNFKWTFLCMEKALIALFSKLFKVKM